MVPVVPVVDVVGKREEYERELEEVVSTADKAMESEADFELDLEEAIPDASEEEGDRGSFPEAWTSFLGRFVQGKKSPLSVVAAEALCAIEERRERKGPPIEVEAVSSKIPLIAERKAYGVSSKSCVVHEDMSALSEWRWEVVSPLLLSASKAAVVKDARAGRRRLGQRIRTLWKLIDILTKHPTDLGKISHEEEKYLKLRREEETAKIKAEALQKKKDEKEREALIKAEALKKKKDEKEREALQKRRKKDADDLKKKDAEDAKRKKEEAKAKKEEARAKKENAHKAQTDLLMKFVKKKSRTSSTPSNTVDLTQQSHEEDGQPNDDDKVSEEDRDAVFPKKTGKKEMVFDLLAMQRPAPISIDELKTLLKESRDRREESHKKTNAKNDDTNDDDDDDDDDVVVLNDKGEKPTQPGKFFYFHDEYRKGHWDYSNRTSTVVTATNPLAMDPNIDYDYDSDEEFAENEAQVQDGEDLDDDDDDDEEGAAAEYEEDDFLLKDQDDTNDDDDDDDDVGDAAQLQQQQQQQIAKRKYRLLIVGPHLPTTPGVLNDTSDDVPPELKAYAVTFYSDPTDIVPPDAPSDSPPKEKTGLKRKPAAAKKKHTTEPVASAVKPPPAQKPITSFFAGVSSSAAKKPKLSSQ